MASLQHDKIKCPEGAAARLLHIMAYAGRFLLAGVSARGAFIHTSSPDRRK